MSAPVSKAYKVFGILTIVFSTLLIPTMVLTLLALFAIMQEPDFTNLVTSQTTGLIIALLVCALVLLVQSFVLGVRLILDKRRRAATQLNAMIAVNTLLMVLFMMVFGFDRLLVVPFASLVFLVVMSSALDPALREERQLQRHLQALEDRSDAEEGILGRDKSGKGYITLNFFNMFWIFVVACVLGDLIETVYVYCVSGGVLMNRTGMLWGPFSPIYGFGALLMTIALNRFYNKHWLITFVVSALIGGAFEYAVSWFFQFAFGIVAWDYSNAALNIDGRTDLIHMIAWGGLGLFWIRVCLPKLLELINRIPWNWRYGVTTVCAALMLFNGIMTMLSFDCWYQREAGIESQTAVTKFFEEHFDNEFMASRFETMSIDPSQATRS